GADLLLEPTRELVIVGTKNSPDTVALLAEVQQQYLPDLTLILRPVDHSEVIDKLIPFIDGMDSMNDQATAYLCQNFACQRPQTSPEKLHELLKQTGH
ncbi:MAG: thioredoxin domain-containing protein, partial [Deltaproteobacteria bacterium]